MLDLIKGIFMSGGRVDVFKIAGAVKALVLFYKKQKNKPIERPKEKEPAAIVELPLPLEESIGRVVTNEIPAWIVSAQKDIGVVEKPGRSHEKKIQKYFAEIGYNPKGNEPDETPWCGAFVGYHLKMSGFTLPKGPARARSWLDFGKPCDNPMKYSVCVIYRNPEKSRFHVGFVVDETETKIKLLNGNSANQVKYTWFLKKDVAGYRRPV